MTGNVVDLNKDLDLKWPVLAAVPDFCLILNCVLSCRSASRGRGHGGLVFGIMAFVRRRQRLVEVVWGGRRGGGDVCWEECTVHRGGGGVGQGALVAALLAHVRQLLVLAKDVLLKRKTQTL